MPRKLSTTCLLLVAGCVLTAESDRAPVELADAAAADAAVADAALVCSQPTATALPVRAIADAIVADGAFEPAWDGAAHVDFSDPGRSNNTARVRALWSPTHLYVAFEVADSELEAVGTVGEEFKDDGSELFLDLGHEAGATIDANDVHFIATIQNLSVSETGAPFTLGTATSSTGFVHELEIAWTDVGAAPVADQVIGALLGNNDRDADVPVQFDWTNTVASGSYYRPDLWGDLILRDEPAAACAGQ